MSFRLAIGQAFSQIGRNKVMAAASLASITAILLVLGVFFIVVVNVNNMAEGVKQDFDQIQVYLEDSVDDARRAELEAQIAALPGVAGTAYLTREEALEQWKLKWGENADLLERMPENPLPNSIIIDVSDLDLASAIVAGVSPLEGVEKVNYSQDTVDRLLHVTRVVQIVSLIIILFLIFISVMVVSNTIKLTVVAREKEIAIMRYVGATNWFIRGPFLLEGVFIGLISAIISATVIGVLYHYFIDRWGVDFLLLTSSSFVDEWFLTQNLLIIFAALGISIGACGSIVSMRKFLER
ncbi:MAG: permease-like cell division protein FtsX [Clostridiales Family XIII bacterium]|jgi:cell division transport system permease protein|nr:permease-like cell division protein FtsX [Clostridiales Family XIII bacterium]